MNDYKPSPIQKNLIYSPNITRARQKLNEILEQDAEYVCGVRCGKDYYELGDNEIFWCVSSVDSSRGRKVDRIYVDMNTDLETLFVVLLPLLVNAKPNYKWGTELEFY